MNAYMKLLIAAALAAPASIALAAPSTATGSATTLAGSHLSMVRQHAVATSADYAFVKKPNQVEPLIDAGTLVRVTPNADLLLSGVSYPFARPDVRDFVDDLAGQYRAALGAPMVVTSLLRPTSLQPSNASPLSVHPTGMAVDLRVPEDSTARAWLEHTLLAMESANVLDVTREHTPSHFHVAVFPAAYRAFAAARDSAAAVAERAALAASQAAVSLVTGNTPGNSAKGLQYGMPAAILTALMLVPLMISLTSRANGARPASSGRFSAK